MILDSPFSCFLKALASSPFLHCHMEHSTVEDAFSEGHVVISSFPLRTGKPGNLSYELNSHSLLPGLAFLWILISHKNPGKLPISAVIKSMSL